MPTLVQADDGSQHLSGDMVQNITSLKSPKLRWEAWCCGQSGAGPVDSASTLELLSENRERALRRAFGDSLGINSHARVPH